MIHLTDKNTPLHEKLEIGLLLAIVGGFLDAYSFLCYGGVFANAQTGNMVLLGISLINGDYINFFHYLIPIIAFSVGILITEYLLKQLSGSFYIWVLITEIIILCIIAFSPDNTPQVVVTAAISFMCSIQIGSFRKICGAPYTSTMCTGNLRSAMELLFIAISNKDSHSLVKGLRYLTIILFFCIGATIGAVFVDWWGKISVLVCCLLFFVLLLLIIRDILYIKRRQQRLSNTINK
ncbi:YoaK family protein [Orbus sturtevantii]|uniref:YoaK family protein n=1 Tax=Orbus sturtevantii TaxID=3074109 RepID=UPI00370D814D